MAAKKPESKPVSTASRKSARLAGSAAPESQAESKKRPASASAPKSGPASKKAKAAPKSNSKTKAIPEEDEGAASNGNGTSKEEKKLEAPKDAEPDTDGAKPLKLGDKLPKVTIEDNEGVSVEVGRLAAEKGVVLFLYPKADTPGCTTQACGYRDAYDEIRQLGYEIYGLSKDKPAAQEKWRKKKELQYKLLSDPDSKLIKKLGAFVQPNNTKRSHFVFEKGTGKLIDSQLGVKPADDPANVVKFIKQHHK